VRLLADLNIAPKSVAFVRSLGHDVARVTDVLPASASAEQIAAFAGAQATPY
jgi:hypothetical protein